MPIRYVSFGPAIWAVLILATTATAESAESPAWPRIDLTRPLVVFVALADGQWDLFAWQPTVGRKAFRLTDTPIDEVRPSLSGDRTFVVYETTDGQLHHLDLKTGETTTLPFASDQRLDMQPAVSPDGKQVLLATAVSPKADDTNLALMNLDQGNQIKHLDFPSSQFLPCWALDQVRLAFVNLHGSGWGGGVTTEIWIARLEPPMARQLTLLDHVCIDPAFSPDGARVVFASNHHGQYDIMAVDIHSREITRLTRHAAADTDPVCSPDGKSILFVSTRGGQLELWVLRDGSEEAVELKPFVDRKARCKDPDWR